MRLAAQVIVAITGMVATALLLGKIPQPNWQALGVFTTVAAVVVALLPYWREARERERKADALRARLLTQLSLLRIELDPWSRDSAYAGPLPNDLDRIIATLEAQPLHFLDLYEWASVHQVWTLLLLTRSVGALSTGLAKDLKASLGEAEQQLLAQRQALARRRTKWRRKNVKLGPDHALLALALLSVGVSLALRIVHRGVEMPGWDLLLSVEGQYLLATRGVWGALRETFVQVRTFWLPPSAYSALYGLLPGALTWWWPGLLWQPLVVFSSWLATLALLLVATGWSLSSALGWGMALLAWGASPSLLSYAVEGYPWGGGMLPHAFVLAMALRQPPLAWSWTLGALALAWELPWHGYEVGKTVGVTLILCALFVPRGGWPRRFAWFLVGAAQLAAVWWVWPSSNLVVLGNGGPGMGQGLVRAWFTLPDGIARLGAALSGSAPLLFPVLVVTGTLALWWARPVAAPWAAQLGLVLLLAAAGPGLLRARRFIVVEGFSIAAILYAGRIVPPRVRVALLALLIGGDIWAIFDAVRFVSAPRTAVAFSLPAVRSDESVGMVDRPVVAWAEGLGRRAQAGERIVVLQSQACPSESHTNPVGVLERLYLRLGHEAFRARIVGVATTGARYVTVPVVDVRSVLDTLEPGATVDLDTTCFASMTDVWQQLTARFHLAPVGVPQAGRFVQLRLEPLPPA